MLIKPNKQYQVLCKRADADHFQLYIWELDLKIGNRAWRIVNQEIEVGSIIHGHLVLSIVDCTPISSSVTYQDSNFTVENDQISEEEFINAINSSSFSYAASPFSGQSYRCQICNGVVANDICTDCMFDWDS